MSEFSVESPGRRRIAIRSALIATLIAAAFAVAACGSGGGAPAGTPVGGIGLDISNCAAPEYGGSGDPTALIVSDLPMQGDSAERSKQQVDAIRQSLENEDWTTRDTNVAFQACDDSIAKTGAWDEQTCEDNATAYAADEHVLGVIGTYNSGCAAIEIPILGKASVAMVSPGNTAVCLTESSPICEDGQPDSLYPGPRNYARVVPNDAFQGAALATYAQDTLDATSPFIAYAADDSTSTGQAENFRGAADELGLQNSGFETWDPKAKSYTDLFEKAKKAGADSVVLAGLTEQNAAQVIKDKVAVLGSNDDVPLIGFDGLAQQSTIDEAGAAADGMYAGLPGLGGDDLPGAGQKFVSQLEETLDGAPVEQFAPYAGEATDVLLVAIVAGGTDRAAVRDAVFETDVSYGLTGPFSIEPSGDPSKGPITVLQAGDSFEPVDVIDPAAAAVTAARG